LVVEIVGDEFVATQYNGQIYRRKWTYGDGGECIEAQLSAFAREFLDDARQLTVVGPNILGDNALALHHVATGPASISRGILAAQMGGVPVEFTSSLLAATAWLGSGEQRVNMPLQSDRLCQLDYNEPLALVLVNLTETDVLTQVGLLHNGLLRAQDTWPYCLPADSYIDTVSYLTARIGSVGVKGVAIVFTPHPSHTAYGHFFQRTASLGFGAWDIPVSLFSDALAVRAGVEIISGDLVNEKVG
jgi:hypothetical protein